MFKPKIKTSLSLAVSLLSIFAFMVTLVYGPYTAMADVVTCNDGSVHNIPNADYACVLPGEGGVKSVAPNPEDADGPGDTCPANFARAGEKIPEGESPAWCNEQQSRASLEGDCTVPLSAVNHNDQDTSNDCGIIAYLVLFTNILSGLVGVIAVIMLVIWGIQYSAARDNPQAVSQAKIRILWTVVAIAVYLFFYIFLQWLVPGGIF